MAAAVAAPGMTADGNPEFWQRLAAAELNPSKSRALLEELGSSHADPISALLSHASLSEKERFRARSAPLHPLENMHQRGIEVLSGDSLPSLLQEMVQPPPCLFSWGDSSVLEKPCIGIVGTRGASTYGKACARKFAEAFALAGVTVVSGGALGIDAAAHQGALAGDGTTVAVLACGVDVPYPAANAPLFRDIAAHGSVISQFALGSKPEAYKFLVRNILIAALSHAVVVIEAPAKSGAIRTASAAADFGREVFVVPANIDNVNYLGSFGLLRDGASIAYHPDHVLESLGLQAVEQPALPIAPADSLAGRILASLTVEPIAVEKIVAAVGADSSDVLAELTMMEIDGTVIRDGHGFAKQP